MNQQETEDSRPLEIVDHFDELLTRVALRLDGVELDDESTLAPVFKPRRETSHV